MIPFLGQWVMFTDGSYVEYPAMVTKVVDVHKFGVTYKGADLCVYHPNHIEFIYGILFFGGDLTHKQYSMLPLVPPKE